MAAKPSAGFTFMIQTPEVGSTNATIYTKVRNPGRVLVQQVGCNIYDASGKLIKSAAEQCYRNETVFNIWYELDRELGLTLSGGTVYQYEFFIDYGGCRYMSHRQTFSTC